MRLLQLNPNGNESSALDFHPMVTVVQQLSPSGRRKVIEAITALPKGLDPGCRGLLEAHGILLDLTPETLALLDLRGELDVLIRPSDLPGAGAPPAQGIQVGGRPVPGLGATPAVDAVGSVLPASVEPLGVDDFLAVTPDGAYPELDAARHGRVQAGEARAVLAEALVRARQGYDEAKVRTRRAQLALDAAEIPPRANLRLVTDGFEPDPPAGGTADDRPGADPAGDASVWASPEPFAASHGLRDDESVEEAVIRTAADRADLEARQLALQTQIERVERGIAELAGLDVRPIQVLLDAINNPAPVEMVPSARAEVLADEFARLQSDVRVLEDSLEARGLGSASAMARLDEARAALTVAEKAMRPPEYTDEDRLELESAHDEVLEAEKKGRSRSGKKRMEEAIVREQAILDRMGFPTWSAYVMGANLMGIDPAAEERLEKARFEFEAAEAHWSNVAAMIEADPVHRELIDRLEAVYLEAFDLLGGDDEQDDLEAKLRNLRVPRREVSMEELVDALAYQLEVVGIVLPPGTATLDRTVMVAEAFLEEAGAIRDRLEELGAEKVEARTELATVEAQLEALPTDDELRADGRDREAAAVAATEALERAAQLDADAAAAIAEAEARAAADSEREAARASAEQTAELERALAAAVEDEQEHLDLVEAREALLDAAVRVETVALSRLNKLAADLAARSAADGTGSAAAPAPPVGSAPAPPGDANVHTEEAFDDASDVQGGPEAVEFYLLARLAALRSASFAGSVPLVIDDALAGRPHDEVENLLHKLERMSETVQIVYLSDDDTVTGWAESIGFERAAVVAAPASFG